MIDFIINLIPTHIPNALAWVSNNLFGTKLEYNTAFSIWGDVETTKKPKLVEQKVGVSSRYRHNLESVVKTTAITLGAKSGSVEVMFTDDNNNGRVDLKNPIFKYKKEGDYFIAHFGPELVVHISDATENFAIYETQKAFNNLVKSSIDILHGQSLNTP